MLGYNFSMAYETILQTKLYRPRTPHYFLPRPHLVEKLNQSLYPQAGIFRHKLGLISAPAGYGKSTLLSEWCNQDLLPTVWLSLDPSDSDLQRFWSHFFAALRTIFTHKHLPSFLRSNPAETPLIKPILDEWINLTAQRSEPFAFVVDDYHLIRDAAVHESLAYWIDHSPAQMQLVIATRSDPPLPLSRLRGRSQIFELRTDDLRFSAAEITFLLNQVMHLQLTPESIAALEARTEGWITGLQMVALALQGRSTQEVSRFIHNFSGSHRYILDYLTDEVLLQQSESVQTFLLQTSILDRFTSSLCDTVTDRKDSQHILAQLESGNLFLIPLDEEQRWYRYHHLFTTMLRHRLERLHPDMVTQINHSASLWCEKNGMMIDALSYALYSGDVGQVARLAAHNVLCMMEFSQLKTLEQWLSELSDKDYQSTPWLYLAQAWLLTSIGKLESAEYSLAQALKVLESSEETSETMMSEVMGNIAAVRAYISGLRGDYTQTIHYAHQMLEMFPPGDAWMHSWGNVTLAYALAHTGKAEEAKQKLAQALEISRKTGASHVHLLALNNYASLKLDKGDLHQAADCFQQAIQLDQTHLMRTGQHIPIAGFAYSHYAKIASEWNDLETADAYIEEGLRICEDWGEPQLLSSGYLRLAEIKMEHAEWAAALEALAKAKKAGGDLAIDYVQHIAPMEALIHLLSGKLAIARRWTDTVTDSINSGIVSSTDRLSTYVLSRIQFASEEYIAAINHLGLLFNHAQTAKDTLSMVRALVLQAIILDKQRKTKQAVALLSQALSLAQPGGYVRSFLTHGARLEHLLMKAVKRGISTPYTHRLLTAFQTEPRSSEKKSNDDFPQVLEETFSGRELQILRLMTTHLTRSQIAQQLLISENTVRTHLKNIYQKLGAHTRAEAIFRARELGILE